MNTIMINGKPVLFLCDQACKKLRECAVTKVKRPFADCIYTHDVSHALWRGETTLIDRGTFYQEEKPVAEVFDHRHKGKAKGDHKDN